MDTLLFTDQPNIEIYVDLARRDVVSVLDRMSNNIDDTLDWQEERLEAKTFDEDLRQSLAQLIVVVPELPQIMRYIHEETHCSFHLAYTYGRKRLMEYYSDTQEALQAKMEYLDEEDFI